LESLLRIDCEFILKYWDNYEEKLHLITVVELWPANDLEKLIRRYTVEKKTFQEPDVFKWLLEVCQAIAYLHSTLGMIHSDLKPSSIYLTNENRVKIGGLDERILTESSLGEAGLRRTDSEPYMSPEMLANNKPFTEETDVWSMGCIVYELLYLKKAFPHTTSKRSGELLDFSSSLLSSIVKK
jgi:serine/threonine protein kinase